MSDPKRLWLSATALRYYSDCPYKFYLSRHWRVHGLKRPKYFAIGDEMHKILAGELEESMAEHSEAVTMARKLQKMVDNLELEIQDKELRQKIYLDGVELEDGRRLEEVTLTRVIDAKGLDWKGNPIMIDYKSAKDTWQELKDSKGNWIAPLAQGVQSVLYTLRGPKQKGTWPTQLMYLVATAKDVRRYIYHKNDEQEQNVLLKIWRVQRDWHKGEFPKNDGYQCTRCAWAGCCYKTEDWENFYQKMEGK